MTRCVRWTSLIPMGRVDLGVSQNMQLQIVAKPPVLCCQLANTNAILPFAKFTLVQLTNFKITANEN